VNTLPLLATCLLRTCFADGLLTHTPCTRSCPRADTSARVRKDSSITSSAQRREPRADESLWIEMPSAQRTAALAIPSFTFDGGPGAQKNRALRHERRETSAPPRSDLKKVEFANSFAQSRRPAARTLLSTPIGTPNRYPGDVADTIRVVRPAHASVAALDKYASADSSPSRSLSPTAYNVATRLFAGLVTRLVTLQTSELCVALQLELKAIICLAPASAECPSLFSPARDPASSRFLPRADGPRPAAGQWGTQEVHEPGAFA